MVRQENRKQCLLTKDLHQRLLAATKNINQTIIAELSNVDRGTVAKILVNSPKQPFHFAKAEQVLRAYNVVFKDEEIVDASISVGKSATIGSVMSAPVVDSPFLTVEAEQLLSQDDFLYLDLRMVEPGQFFPNLCGLLGIAPPLRGVELQRKLSGKKYVLCLDEIDQLTDQERFSKNDRDQLCGMCFSGLPNPRRPSNCSPKTSLDFNRPSSPNPFSQAGRRGAGAPSEVSGSLSPCGRGLG